MVNTLLRRHTNNDARHSQLLNSLHSKKLQESRVAFIKATLLLAIVAFCFFESILCSHNGIFHDFETLLLQLQIQWMLFTCVAVWCLCLIFLTFRLNDLPLIGFLLIAISMYAACYASAWPTADAMTLMVGITLGLGMRLCFSQYYHYFVIASLIILLALSSWCHLNMRNNPYHGPRWMGLWDNPNTYGMLMGAGGLLALGLLAANSKFKIKYSKTSSSRGDEAHFKLQQGENEPSIRASSRRLPQGFLLIAAGMMTVGLAMSYSRGAWLGATTGLLYLAWSYGRLKWRYVLPVAAVAAVAVLFLWGSTPDSAPWYIKRADLRRPSAQHRATAWRAGLEIMRDHPLGVGWNNAVSVYAKDYSPPEDGAAALTTNDYLMLGTELGIAALVCFVSYCVLCLRGKCRVENEEGRIQAACRAGVIVFLVAFWFDGGLFKLPTAALFWVLLELGAYRKRVA